MTPCSRFGLPSPRAKVRSLCSALSLSLSLSLSSAKRPLLLNADAADAVAVASRAPPSPLAAPLAAPIRPKVEYYLNDINYATTDHLMRFISKDPEGYVPISLVASFKKIKVLITSNAQLSSILQNSSKHIVSEDRGKVKWRYPLIDSDMEELQSRVVIAENLPEDHCHQNLMKLFSAVGRQ